MDGGNTIGSCSVSHLLDFLLDLLLIQLFQLHSDFEVLNPVLACDKENLREFIKLDL